MSVKPNVLVLLRPSLYATLFPPEADAALRATAHLTFHSEERNVSSAELAQRIAGYDAIITGWGTPTFTDEVLDGANRLRLIAHSAGSIKKMLPPAVFARGIAVTHAASAIAPAVAEMTLTLIMMSLRQVHRLDHLLKSSGDWGAAKEFGLGQELVGNSVGVVGAGYTGRCVINLLTALNVNVWVYDPYLTSERAQALGVHRVAELDTIFRDCPIVTVQLPTTDETYHMIGARQLRLLRDGAIFVNTARAWCIDMDALLAELQTGRFLGAIDVFDQEPQPPDSPFFKLDNVIVTPHVAGATLQSRERQGWTIVEEVKRFFADEELRFEVTAAMLQTMA